jgi:AmmeMemoRadiSam system protein A
MPVSSFINLTSAEQSKLKSLVCQVLTGAITEKSLQPPDESKYPGLLVPAACFVTLYKNDQLRGCIGTYSADMALWFNVCRYSYCSAFEDRRFTPLQEKELKDIRFEISILSELEPIENNGEQALLQNLKVGKDGLLMSEKGYHSAIFLPSVWDVLATPFEFVQALKRKGGWRSDYWNLDIKLFRFSTFVIAGEAGEALQAE